MIWSSTEIGVLARAVSHAPSVHNTQPWTMEARAESAELYERLDVALPHHDPAGRDRLISCGAALANLELAVRALGWAADITLFPDAGRPDLVAVVGTAGRQETTAAEVERYAAIFRRHSHRRPFDLHPISRGALRGLAGAVNEPGVQARPIDPRTECATLAELFDYAAGVLREDQGYQRELTSWTAGPADTTLPWGGLVRADTHIPDTVTLTERLMREGILMLLTPDDTRRDHLLAGVAMQQIWLSAITHGMVASVLTQPLHLHEVRAALIERLGLAGYPQVFLRLGHPTPAGPEVPEGEDERKLSATPVSS